MLAFNKNTANRTQKWVCAS